VNPRKEGRAGERARDALQALGILCIGGLFAMIAHKGYADVTALAAKYSGTEFWVRFARYVIANLGG
jgi:hypothetical protein